MQVAIDRFDGIAPPAGRKSVRPFHGPTPNRAHSPIVFSTSGLPDCDRLGAWQNAFVDTFVPCRIERNSEEPFWSEFKAMTVGPVVLGSVAGPAKICTRDKSAVDRHRGDYLHLHLMRRGEKVSRQCGRETPVSAGEALVYHNRQPSSTVAPTPTQVSTIKVPDSAVRGRLGETARFAGVKLSSHIPELRILADYVQSLDFAGDLTEASVREMVARHIVDLIVAALTRIEGRENPGDLHSIKAARLAAIKRLVEDTYSEPTFDTRHAARKLGISERYIQKLFEETGVTFSDYIVERRLLDAREKLRDRSLGRMNIQDIAWSAGFSDISHFNRMFRRRFGEKPSALRGG